MATIETPIINPVAGTYKDNVKVTLRCGTPNVAIYYTTDGSTPDATDNLYVDGTPIEITATTTVKAIGILSGWTNSSVATSTFTIEALSQKYNFAIKHTGAGEPFRNALLADVACCDNPFYYFNYGFNWQIVGPGDTVTIYVRGGCPPYTWALSGDGAADYSFAEAETSVPYNDVTAVAEPNGLSTTITVTDACNNQVSALLNNDSPRTAPVKIYPISGTYNYFLDIVMSCATPGSAIYYTTDGSDPDSGDNLYAGTFELSETQTIKAIGITANYRNSLITTREYTIESAIIYEVDKLFNGSSHWQASGTEYFDNGFYSGKLVYSDGGSGASVYLTDTYFNVTPSIEYTLKFTCLTLSGTVYARVFSSIGGALLNQSVGSTGVKTFNFTPDAGVLSISFYNNLGPGASITVDDLNIY